MANCTRANRLEIQVNRSQFCASQIGLKNIFKKYFKSLFTGCESVCYSSPPVAKHDLNFEIQVVVCEGEGL
jgi:hypothetical protein